jgi:hypothetical protein
MTPRRAVTGLLLTFVAVSVGYLALRSIKAAREWPAPDAVQAADRTPESSTRAGDKIVAYYFHVTVRCTTCRAIEAYTKEVIHQRFANEIAGGRIEWRLVNVQLPENRHFIQDYQLFTKSLVLALMKDGRQQEYKVLNDTWELVGDKAAMQRYVEKEIRGYLRKL